MVEHGSNASHGEEDEHSEGVDFDEVRRNAGFILRSAWRRRKLTISTFLVLATFGLTIAATMPRTYTAQVKLLAQRSSAIHILGGALPQMDSVDNPIKNVSVMIMRRDNLINLVRDADLVNRIAATRPGALRLKDRVMSFLFGAPSDEDMQQSAVFTLEKRLDVTTDDPTSTVTITVDWSDPQLAYDLVTLVQKNFLEARYDSDIAMVTDSISVLEDHAKTEMSRVDAELDVYQKVVQNWSVKQQASAKQEESARDRPVHTFVPELVRGSPSAAPPDPEVVKALEEKRLEIHAEEEAHQRSIDALKQELIQAQLTLTPMHPTVIALQQQLEALNQPSAEYTQLRNQERSMLAQIATSTSAAPGPAPLPRFVAHSDVDADAGVDSIGEFLPTPALDRDGQLQLAQSKLQSAIRGYEDSLGRLDAARVELEITRTAYKHQYTVETPAEVPRRTKKPTAQILAVVSILGGALLAVLLAAGLDVLTGRILESWQVRSKLKLEILGELDKPA